MRADHNAYRREGDLRAPATTKPTASELDKKDIREEKEWHGLGANRTGACSRELGQVRKQAPGQNGKSAKETAGEGLGLAIN